MKIAQIAPLHESVPPKTYGGIERVVHYLTEELVKLGHEVTLFASGDSQTSAQLCSIIPESLRKSSKGRNPIASHVLSYGRLLEQLADYDVVHFHTEFYQFMLEQTLCVPHFSTLHCRLDTLDYAEIFKNHTQMPVVSISNAQREPVPNANWIDTVYNGIPEDNFTFKPNIGQEYLAFVGRISPLKNPIAAIEIAIQANIPIKIAAKVDPWDQEYFDSQFKPYLSHPLVEYIGEINELEKNELLGNALGLLFPIDWPEPFGLVMIEAMACGTPVIAFNNGAVPEVMQNYFTGYIVNSVEEAVKSVSMLSSISREYCRHYFLKRFSASTMAENYVQLYSRQIMKSRALFSPISSNLVNF